MDAAEPRPHKILVRVLLGVATVLAVLAIFSVWANRQALNADNWSHTSAQILANPAVKTQLSNYLVDQLFTNVDVAGELQTALPPRLQPLAGPAAGALRQLAGRTALVLLTRPRVEAAWERANKLTAQQFINVAENKSKAITAQGSAVVLNVGTILDVLVQQLGLPSSLTNALPAGAGNIKILDSDQVGVLQDSVNILRSLALILPILSLGMFAVAVWLARGRRRETIMWVGVDLILAGCVVLVLRHLLGSYVTDALAADQAARPAVDATWSIGTQMLRDVAQATIIGGLPLLFAAWVAGPTRFAVESRRRLAPFLYENPGAAYGILAFILLVIVAWGPIPATQKVIPVIIMCALAAFGLHQLRRQTLEEYPQDLTAELPPVEPPADAPQPPPAPAGVA